MSTKPNMWWPSFISVLRDLGKFSVGLPSEQLYVGFTQFTPQTPVATPLVSYVESTKPADIRLEENVRYTAEHTTTKSIRTYLQTETTIKPAVADLTAYEWLAYTFTKTGRPLPWLALAMAPIGYWHQTLKGQQYVGMSVVPRTHALIEWQDEQKSGQVGLVTAVAPDESITVEQVGATLPGVLSKLTLSAEQWRELRPVFINVR